MDFGFGGFGGSGGPGGRGGRGGRHHGSHGNQNFGQDYSNNFGGDPFSNQGYDNNGFNQGFPSNNYNEGGFGNNNGFGSNEGYNSNNFGGDQYGNQYGSGNNYEQGGFNQGGFNQGGFNQGGFNNQMAFGLENIGGQLSQWFKQDPNVHTNFQIRDKVVEQILYQPNFMGQMGDWQKERKRNNNSTIRQNQGLNIASLLTKQVVMIQSCPLQQKIEQLKAQGKKYQDTVFPASLSSLTGEHGEISEWKTIKWKAASDIATKCRLFDELIQPNDIKQGKLGDCYLLAALAALAEQPQRILNLFLIPKQNPQGYYVCKILYKGKWKTIDLDEMIPAIGNNPAFSKADNQELWVVMLEKAWAKLYASYKRIQAGYPEEGLHDLTGAHIRAIRFKNKDFNKTSQWEYLTDATERKFCMIASSQPGSDTNISVSGIVDGHAYTFLGAYELEYQGKVQKICKLRNPWGKSQSTGKWSDSDSRWAQVSQEEIKRVGYSKQNDGMFFMTYDDFVNNFRMLTIAEVNDNASYLYSTQKSTAAKGNYFKVKIMQEGNYSFQINQIPERTYPDKDQESHRYANATIKIGKISGNGKYQQFEGSTSAYRTLFRRHTLPPGQYVIWGKIDFSEKWERDFELTLAIYADFVCEIQNITENDCPGFNKSLDRGDVVKKELISGGVGADESHGGKRKSRRRHHRGGDFNQGGFGNQGEFGNQGGFNNNQGGFNQGGYEQGNWGGNQQPGQYGGEFGGGFGGNQNNQYGGGYDNQNQFGGQFDNNNQFGGNNFGSGQGGFGGFNNNQGGFGQGGW